LLNSRAVRGGDASPSKAELGITDAKALSERDVDFEIHIRRVEEE
jgi:hypothetical protein